MVKNQEAPEWGKVKATDIADIEKRELVSFGPPRIQTAEDAREAYLRQQISEEDFKAYVGKFGTLGEQLWIAPNRLERGDEAFERTLPDALFTAPAVRILNAEERIEEAKKKEEVREAATGAAEEVVRETKPQIDLAEIQNERARQAAEKVEEKQQKQLQADTKDGPRL